MGNIHSSLPAFPVIPNPVLKESNTFFKKKRLLHLYSKIMINSLEAAYNITFFTTDYKNKFHHCAIIKLN